MHKWQIRVRPSLVSLCKKPMVALMRQYSLTETPMGLLKVAAGLQSCLPCFGCMPRQLAQDNPSCLSLSCRTHAVLPSLPDEQDCNNILHSTRLCEGTSKLPHPGTPREQQQWCPARQSRLWGSAHAVLPRPRSSWRPPGGPALAWQMQALQAGWTPVFQAL